MIIVKCEGCDKFFEVCHLSECTYTILANGTPIGEHELCRKCANMNNKDENGLYWYEMLLRPLSPGAQPVGFLQYNSHEGNRHGTIAYNRKLTVQEMENYDLTEWMM